MKDLNFSIFVIFKEIIELRFRVYVEFYFILGLICYYSYWNDIVLKKFSIYVDFYLFKRNFWEGIFFVWDSYIDNKDFKFYIIWCKFINNLNNYGNFRDMSKFENWGKDLIYYKIIFD